MSKYVGEQLSLQSQTDWVDGYSGLVVKSLRVINQDILSHCVFIWGPQNLKKDLGTTQLRGVQLSYLF